jgi:hypothetical protein
MCPGEHVFGRVPLALGAGAGLGQGGRRGELLAFRSACSGVL